MATNRCQAAAPHPAPHPARVATLLFAQIGVLALAATVFARHGSLAVKPTGSDVGDPADLLVAVGGWVGLALGTLTTTATAALLVGGRRPLPRALAPWLLPTVARLALPGTLAVGLSGGLLPLPAGATSDDPVARTPYTVDPDAGAASTRGDDLVVRTPTEPTATPPTTRASSPPPSDRDAEREPPPAPIENVPGPVENPSEPVDDARPRRHTVRPGDHLWGIAQSQLEIDLGRVPSKSEVADYWSRVVDRNRARLRSGNPNLIFPGEVIVLPPNA